MKGDFYLMCPIIFEGVVNLAGLANNISPTVFPIANDQFPIASVEWVKKKKERLDKVAQKIFTRRQGNLLNWKDSTLKHVVFQKGCSTFQRTLFRTWKTGKDCLH